MKVDGSLRSTAPAGAPKKPATRGKDTSTGAPRQDSVSLSDTSSQMQILEASINQASDIDIGKVESVKQAINDGSFKVDAEQVADNLIASTRELASKQKRA